MSRRGTVEQAYIEGVMRRLLAGKRDRATIAEQMRLLGQIVRRPLGSAGTSQCNELARRIELGEFETGRAP